MERTFMMVKPDGVKRGLSGQIISRVEKQGFKLIALKMLTLTAEMSRKHYAEHLGKDFYPELEAYITSGPVVAMIWEGKDAVASIRQIMGATNPMKAMAGTIRGDFGIDISRNTVHGSDSVDSAQREIALYFRAEEIQDYCRV